MKAINDRVYQAMVRLGKTRVDIAELFGMDPSIPLSMQPVGKVPRPTMENVVKLSVFMGISVKWILYGEAENDVDLFVIGPPSCEVSCHLVKAGGGSAEASKGGAIITGAQNSTVVVQHINGEDLSELERAVIESIRKLEPRKQAEAMSFILSMEHEAAEKQKEAPSE